MAVLPCLPAALRSSFFFFYCKGFILYVRGYCTRRRSRSGRAAAADRAAGRAYREYCPGLPPLLLAVVLAVAVAFGLLAPCIYICIKVLIRLSSVKTQVLPGCCVIAPAGLAACPAVAPDRWQHSRQAFQLLRWQPPAAAPLLLPLPVRSPAGAAPAAADRSSPPALQPSGAASDDLKKSLKKI